MPETGVTDQARAMLDRVSPEGRARALKAQRRRQAQTNKLILRSLLAGIIVAVLTAAVIGMGIPIGSPGILGAVAAWLIVSVVIVMASRERPATSDALAATRLHQLPDVAGRWLESQRAALPAPAVKVADDILQVTLDIAGNDTAILFYPRENKLLLTGVVLENLEGHAAQLLFGHGLRKDVIFHSGTKLNHSI